MDKWRSKMIWLANGLPLIAKPANEGSTLGLTKVSTAAELKPVHELAAQKYHDIALAEQFIAVADIA